MPSLLLAPKFMTSEEFLVLKQMMKQNQRHLLTNQRHLEHIVEHIDKDRWYIAFGSDVAANVLTTSAFWLLQKLLSKK